MRMRWIKENKQMNDSDDRRMEGSNKEENDEKTLVNQLKMLKLC
jgi:hypothetical protein